MWLATKYGFFSVVAHQDDPDLVQVRARSRDDLEHLRGFAQGRDIPVPDIVMTPANDYCCRIFMTRRSWTQLGGELATEIDYPNFKEQVRGEPARDAAYMQMWSIMRRYQEQKLGMDVRDPDALPAVDPRRHVQERVDYGMRVLNDDSEFAALSRRIKMNIANVLAQEIGLAVDFKDSVEAVYYCAEHRYNPACEQGVDWTDPEDGWDEPDEWDEDEVFDFLDTLRDSGVTHMWGARPYLQETFGFDRDTAAGWLTRWMESYGRRHGLEAQP
ncbi:MAG: hypothetical protein WBO55_09030 [Rhizobiaceae bacterium]